MPWTCFRWEDATLGDRSPREARLDRTGALRSGPCRPMSASAGHNSDGKFIARAQRIEYDCELVPRRVAIFIEKTKDGQILPVPNVVVRDVACGANHTVRLHCFSPQRTLGFAKQIMGPGRLEGFIPSRLGASASFCRASTAGAEWADSGLGSFVRVSCLSFAFPG